MKSKAHLKSAAIVGLSLLAGLAVVEAGLALWGTPDSRFLDIFEADAELGVRLQKNAETTLRSREGRRTKIETHRLGFRGDLPEIGGTLLLGDSQVFGFGVEQAHTMSAALETQLGSSVYNAAVPTYGPHEFALVGTRLVAEYAPKNVVVVINSANDFFEAGVPNTKRTTARDGLAQRSAAKASATTFENFARRSQLVKRVEKLNQYRKRKDITLLQRPRNVAARLLEKNSERLLREKSELKIVRAIEELIDACANRCQVFTAVLPLDVAIDAREWKKYRATDNTLFTQTVPLERAYEAAAANVGAHVFDLRADLKRASPGVFLDDDYHLSAKGHHAVAHAIAEAIASSSPLAHQGVPHDR